MECAGVWMLFKEFLLLNLDTLIDIEAQIAVGNQFLFADSNRSQFDFE